MAEFAKVAHEWVRMCKAYSDAGDCMKCPMVTNPICGCMSDDNGASEKEIAKAEADIMSWAAEHPEPVYPSWLEHLMDTYHDCGEAYMNGNDALWKWMWTTRIPADIAQKLGLQPKEG